MKPTELRQTRIPAGSIHARQKKPARSSCPPQRRSICPANKAQPEDCAVTPDIPHLRSPNKVQPHQPGEFAANECRREWPAAQKTTRNLIGLLRRKVSEIRAAADYRLWKRSEK